MTPELEKMRERLAEILERNDINCGCCGQMDYKDTAAELVKALTPSEEEIEKAAASRYPPTVTGECWDGMEEAAFRAAVRWLLEERVK